MDNITPQTDTIDWIYKDRTDFTIIALTGATGSGCTELADLMCKRTFDEFKGSIRDPNNIKNINNEKDIEIFKRKYSICYNFTKKKYYPFKIIKYKNVLLYYLLEYIIAKKGEKDERTIIDRIIELLADKFCKSKKGRDDLYKPINTNFSKSDFEGLVNNELILLFTKDYNLKDDNIEKKIYKNFNDIIFISFCNNFYELLKKKDYYLKNFFVHRLSGAIRATKNPFAKYKDGKYDTADNSNTFELVKLINKIIKGQHKADKNDQRHIVIDSIRNSLEAHFLNERYTAFYLIAVHDSPDNQKENITNKISSYGGNKETTEKIYYLGLKEGEEDDFEKGKLFAPDIKRCVANSEIHIYNKKTVSDNSASFKSLGEQWLKYFSLINHPGLITPNTDERCMQIAFTAKYNSGCISRQVGAVITDKYNAIKSIGWNDVPCGQIPCLLRDINEIYDESATPNENVFSAFERGNINRYDKGTNSFIEKVRKDEQICIDKINKKGLNYAFCFKTLENKYKEEKNQVYTRSLHAEENAMMQIAKVGGNGLEGGTMFVTASPCVLCSKKSYQLGIRRIVYIDPYPDIAIDQILHAGFNNIKVDEFEGAVGKAYLKLYQPFLSYKDELAIRTKE